MTRRTMWRWTRTACCRKLHAPTGMNGHGVNYWCGDRWQCRNIFGHSLDPECTCTCDGEVIGDDFWNDKRCKGIQVGSNIQV